MVHQAFVQRRCQPVTPGGLVVMMAVIAGLLLFRIEESKR